LDQLRHQFEVERSDAELFLHFVELLPHLCLIHLRREVLVVVLVVLLGGPHHGALPLLILIVVQQHRAPTHIERILVLDHILVLVGSFDGDPAFLVEGLPGELTLLLPSDLTGSAPRTPPLLILALAPSNHHRLQSYPPQLIHPFNAYFVDQALDVVLLLVLGAFPSRIQVHRLVELQVHTIIPSVARRSNVH